MAEAFLQVLLDNLSSLMKDEIGLIMGVDVEMKKLSSTLTTIQAVLEDAQDKQLTSKPIQNWLRKLDDLTFEIDDVLDECATQVSKLKHKNSKLNRFSLNKILSRRKIGRRIKEVTEKLDAIATERKKFHLREMVVERQSKVAATRETSSVLNEPDLVYGRDGEMEKIVDILVNQVQDSQDLSVLPILGVGGLGKTTLAQLVYNHPSVTQHFEKRLWVCVSDNFDMKTLVQTMIKSATGCESTSDHLDTLQRSIRELLNQKKYLLILDDVWNEDQEEWAKLRSILLCGSSGASIVVTTRLKKVADIMGTLPALELSKLLEEHCWSLFRQRAFGQDMGKHPKLETIGKEIVKKCGGVPLAAKALGGLLRFKREEKEWLYVKESEIWNLQTSIMPALRLSYHHLPLQLRQCFAYCTVYPKDHEMEKEEVIHCWMAHGYISSNGTMDVEDVGDDVWNELVLRSLFQDVGDDVWNELVLRSFSGDEVWYELLVRLLSQYVSDKVRIEKLSRLISRGNDGGKITFKMHDLVHDLAQSIMENKVPGDEVKSNDRGATNRNKIRQVNVRERYVAFENEVHISYTLKNFPHLRVLDASEADVEDLPSEIDKLKHLRYLNLSSSNSLRTLPDTVCSLWNLQILNLNYCSNLVKLPKRMRYMKNLRHLFLDGCDSLREMPPKIGELTSLKTLTIFIVGQKRSNQLDELQHLNLGGKLEIKHLARVKNHLDAKKANMGNKSNLRELVLSWEGKNAYKQQQQQQQEMDEKVLEALEPHSNLERLEIHGFKGKYFPPWTRMDNLIKICIENFPNCLRLLPLGHLPRLKRLELTNLVMLEYVMENEVGGGGQVKDAILFPSLEVLNLFDVPNLKGLLKHEEEVGQIFPNLQTLLTRDVSSLLKFPQLSSLDMLRCGSLNLNSLHRLQNLTYLELRFDNDMRTCIIKEILENLSNLKKLLLHNVKEHNLPIEEEGLQGLNSLLKLWIQNWDTLTCLPDVWLRHLTSLKSLHIYHCEELVEFLLPTDGMGMIYSLQSLSLKDLPQLTSLPVSFGNLTSLEYLRIEHCPSLTSLPASIQRMTNLRNLQIYRCPELARRCEKEKGEDWHIIAHIPDLYIGD